MDRSGFESAIDLLALRGFQPYLLQVIDDHEEVPNVSGSVRLVDVAYRRRRTTFLEEIDVTNYRRVFSEFSAACRRYCARRSIGMIQARTGIPFQESVLRIIRTATSRMYAR